jgi:hypothetical protein
MQGCAAYFSRAPHLKAAGQPLTYRSRKLPITHTLFDAPLLFQIGTELLDFASTFGWTTLKLC